MALSLALPQSLNPPVRLITAPRLMVVTRRLCTANHPLGTQTHVIVPRLRRNIHLQTQERCFFLRRTYAGWRFSLPAAALVDEAEPLGATFQPVPLDAGVRHSGGVGARHEARHGLLGVAARRRIWKERKRGKDNLRGMRNEGSRNASA